MDYHIDEFGIIKGAGPAPLGYLRENGLIEVNGLIIGGISEFDLITNAAGHTIGRIDHGIITGIPHGVFEPLPLPPEEPKLLKDLMVREKEVSIPDISTIEKNPSISERQPILSRPDRITKKVGHIKRRVRNLHD